MQEIKNLIARALAAMEDPSSLTETETRELREDLNSKLAELESTDA